MPTVTFTWQTRMDGRTCKKCIDLNGYQWVFKDEFPDWLDHPKHGIVYAVELDQSCAHGLAVYNCRCRVNIEIDDSDVLEGLNQIKKRKATLDETLDSCKSRIDAFLMLLEAQL